MSTLTERDVRIEELTYPTAATNDDPHWANFAEMVAIRNEIAKHVFGSSLFARSPESALPGYLDPYNPSRAFLLRVDGAAAGRAVLSWTTEEGSTLAFPNVEVLPAYRGRGYGTMLADRIEALAAELGRTTLQTWPDHTNAEGERIEPPTGFGSVSTGDPGVRFLRRRGYSLEQVERISVLDLPVDQTTLETMRAKAEAASTDYRVLSWIGPAPEDRLEDLCWLRNRMSVDIPAGAMEVEEETWTAERIRNEEQRAADAGQSILTVAAEHIPTGKLVGYSVLWVHDDRSRAVDQDATLVVSEHRGHKLGQLLKVANIEQLARFSPESPMIITGNAEENRYMLATNEAVGFRAIVACGAWEKKLSS
ncbi:MAG TPA: GNAT family N-acetyltransferase [Thermomicrobiales bacterium]|jgi:GNAT superfamily N-acetyltransferase|nr:GNAT family N-acetyltransferase [Thermomicrobiales bacterium]